jgi:trans-aconitate methyltransferase
VTAEGLWRRYNLQQAQRTRPRELLTSALALTDRPGLALDLGAGAGIESKAMLDQGWIVHALDSDRIALEQLSASVSSDVGSRLHTMPVDLTTVDALPRVDLIYSGYTLSWLPPAGFEHVLGLILASLRPDGLLAVNLFGDRDDWASRPDTTCLHESRVRELLSRDLHLEYFDAKEYHGMAFNGPKHWHVFDVIGRRRPAS